jgi:hypothetical protein
MSDKIKIMYLTANPIDTSHLRLQEEARELEERIRQGPRREAFEVIHCLAVRPRDLLRGLQEVQPHILHFSGHGNYDKEIVLQGDDGNSRPIAPQDLARLVELFKTNLKVALMSCCYGRRQAKALHRVLDFTIGMNQPISDVGAVSFSANFYQVLASGGSVRQSFESARLVTTMDGRAAFGVSDLLVREGADADKPFVDVLPLRDAEPERRSPQHNEANVIMRDTSAGVVSTVGGDNARITNKL